MLGLCTYCMDEGPSRDEGCAHPECPAGGGKAFASTRLAPRSPTRPSLVGGPRAEVVPPEDVGPTPHIGTQPSLSGHSSAGSEAWRAGSKKS